MSDKMATKSENGFIWLIVECVCVIEASLKLLTNSIELKTSNCIGFFCILSSDAMVLICLSAQKAPRILILFTYLFIYFFWSFFYLHFRLFRQVLQFGLHIQQINIYSRTQREEAKNIVYKFIAYRYCINKNRRATNFTNACYSHTLTKFSAHIKCDR